MTRGDAAAADVLGHAHEMHHVAFRALGYRFKLRNGFYTEPISNALKAVMVGAAAPQEA